MSTRRNHVRRMKNYSGNTENILKRQFSPTAQNMAWVSDIIFIGERNILRKYFDN